MNKSQLELVAPVQIVQGENMLSRSSYEQCGGGVGVGVEVGGWLE